MTQLSGYCTSCGGELEGNSNFCTRCGAPTSQTLQDDVEETKKQGNSSRFNIRSTALEGEAGLLLVVVVFVYIVVVMLLRTVGSWLSWKVAHLLLRRCIHRFRARDRWEHGIRTCDGCGAWQTASFTQQGSVEVVGPWQPAETRPKLCLHLGRTVTQENPEGDVSIRICLQCGSWRHQPSVDSCFGGPEEWQPSDTCPNAGRISQKPAQR